jgi:hypothetical protein
MSEKTESYLANTLLDIISHVDAHRPRGFHVYPTELRDEAVQLLIELGYEVKDYKEYERETEIKYYKGAK